MSRYLEHVSIMIVDDQEFIARMLRQMLKVLGAQDIQVFESGEEAWKVFQKKPVDIVIADWEMKPMDGLELTRLIRKDDASPNKFVPIIMVTAYREKHQVLAARDAGVTEYVVKPVAAKPLFSRIEAVIEKPRRFVRIGDFFGPDRRRHNAAFEGEDRRGKGAKPAERKPMSEAQKQAERRRDLGQDEINATFNPNDAAE